MGRILSVCLLVLFPVCAARGQLNLSSVQSGEYDTSPTDPWNAGGNPDNGGGSDRCTVNSGHTVTIEDAGDATTDTIIVQPGGVFFSKRDVENTLSSATVILNGGTFRRNTWAASQTQTVGGDFDVRGGTSVFDVEDDGDAGHLVIYDSLNFTNSNARLSFVNTGARAGNRDRFGSALFTVDAEIAVDASVQVYPSAGRIELQGVTFGGAGNRKLVKTGFGTLGLQGDNTAGIPVGSSIAVAGGTLRLMDAGSAGGASFVVSNGTVRAETAGALAEGATVYLCTNGTLYCWRDQVGILTNVTVTLDGGAIQYESFDAPKYQLVGGTFRLVSSSTFDALDTGNNMSAIVTHGPLLIGRGDVVLSIIDSNAAGTRNNTTRFVGSVVSNDCTIDVHSYVKLIQLHDSGVAAGATMGKTGSGSLETTGNLYVHLAGGADMVGSTNVTLIDWSEAPGTLTANHAFQDADGLWTGGSGSNTVTATLGLNKGTISSTGGRARFEPAASGHVTIRGLVAGKSYMYGMKFANMTSTIEAIVARLGENPDYESVSASGSDGVKFRMVSDVEGTGYFCWDNVVNGLGADVVSVSAGFGTVLTVF